MTTPDEKSLYANMRAAIRGDRERAARRAEQKASDPAPPSPPDPSGSRRFAAIRRLLGGRREV